MRASVHKDDPGYFPMDQTRRIRIFFEGVEVSGVVTADEEQRLIVQLDRDEKGRLYVDRKTGCAATVTRYGHVRIEVGE
jgi:hypothetical protein